MQNFVNSKSVCFTLQVCIPAENGFFKSSCILNAVATSLGNGSVTVWSPHLDNTFLDTEALDEKEHLKIIWDNFC